MLARFLARQPGVALSASAWATLPWLVLAWAAPVAGYLLADPAGPQRLAVLAVAMLAVAAVSGIVAGASIAHALTGIPLIGRATALRDKS